MRNARSWTSARAFAGSMIAALLLNGCALPSRTAGDQVSTYLLEWSPGEPPSTGARSCPTLLVATPRAAPGFATGRMVYRKGSYQVEYFASHRWVDSPAQMIQPLLVRSMERTGRYRAVVGPDAGGQAGLLLDADGLRLEQVFDGAQSSVNLAARVSLVDLARQQVLGAREIRVEEPAAGADPRAGVVAANRAVARFLERLASFVDGVLAAHPSACDASSPG